MTSVCPPPLSDADEARPSTASGPPLVGVFDSGVGGLSVLSALMQRLPQAPMIYVADSGHAPYGDRHDDHATQRTLRLTRYLVDQGAGLLVIACNTATAAAIAVVRERWPQLAVVGVEPGIKPAMKLSRNRRVGVMATPATLRSDKFVRLMQQHAADGHLVLQPCPGLARAIEGGDADSAETSALIEAYGRPLREAGVDTVVLGCTHYAFARSRLQAVLGPEVSIVDTAEAVARQAAALHALAAGSTATNLSKLGSPLHGDASAAPRVTLVSTGDARLLSDVAQRWLSLRLDAVGMPDL